MRATRRTRRASRAPSSTRTTPFAVRPNAIQRFRWGSAVAAEPKTVMGMAPLSTSRITLGRWPFAMTMGIPLAQAIFAAVGEVVSIDETMMDAFAAVAGSGPAYVFYLAEAMSAAAVQIGFNLDQADLIVRHTIAGAGNLMVALAADSTDPADPTDVPSSPAALRAAVTSKNGTTHAATTRMDELGVMEAIITAVRAARDRGRELAQE